MQSVNTQVLNTVREPLSVELDAVVKLSDDFGHIYSEELAQELQECCCRIKGAFSMLGMTGADNLAGEMAEVAGNGKSDPATNAEQLQRAARFLSCYFECVVDSGKDYPLLLITELNALRKSMGKPLWGDADLLGSALPQNKIVEYPEERTQAQREIQKRAHQLYQKGLLHLIRGQARSAALRVMSHGATLLANALLNKQEKLYWQTVSAITGAMAIGQLSVQPQRLRLLMGIERQLAALGKGVADLERCYPVSLEQGMIACLMLTDIASENIRRLADRLGIDVDLVSDHELQGMYSKICPDEKGNAAENLRALEGYTGELRLLLDEFSGQNDGVPISHSPLPKLLLNVAELAGSLGLSVAQSRFDDHRAAAEASDFSEPSLILSLADSVMYLECVLLEFSGKAASEQQLAGINRRSVEEMIEANIVLHAEKQVLREAILALESVMQAVTDYCDGAADESIIGEQAAKFDVVFGASRMLKLNRASIIAEQCKKLFASDFGAIGISKEALLETVADAIVSLEFFLESRSRSEDADEQILAVAEEALQLLEK
ncbi:MAG: hypothetical protein R3E73_09395 [Porticoccaceae bacterium]|nr:hypothetical protein [Pseudomonadales bacterium]MCP5171525.1 hypothetical protein [Pseudomonadales bacterium]